MLPFGTSERDESIYVDSPTSAGELFELSPLSRVPSLEFADVGELILLEFFPARSDLLLVTLRPPGAKHMNTKQPEGGGAVEVSTSDCPLLLLGEEDVTGTKAPFFLGVVLSMIY